jgi:hypothetical protein
LTNTVSHLCGFADTTNTGVPVGTPLVSVPSQCTGSSSCPQAGSGWTWNSQYGEIQTTADNAVIKNVIVSSGSVDLFNSGSTFEDSDVQTTGSGEWPVMIRHASNITIKDNNIHGSGTAVGSACEDGIRDVYGDSQNLTAMNNNIWYCTSGMNNIVNGGLIEQNYIHDHGFAQSDSHLGGIEFEPGNGQLMTVRDNTIFNPKDQTTTLMLANDGGGTETNRLIDHNLIGGGGYCFYGSGVNPPQASNITFTNNHFSRLFFPNCGYWGPDADWKQGNGDLWSGNVWDDTGVSLGP